jgi:glutamyl/glutaminyl-tRNA synthetase
MPNLGKPLRIALFGKASGANLADILAVLGVKEIKKRVDNFCKLSIL